MFDEIYTWLESYAGVSYDFDESIKEIDASNAFIDPFNWRVSIEIILNQLDDACDIIDMYWKAIPTALPPRDKMKRLLTQNTLQMIVTNMSPAGSDRTGTPGGNTQRAEQTRTTQSAGNKHGAQQ